MTEAELAKLVKRRYLNKHLGIEICPNVFSDYMYLKNSLVLKYTLTKSRNRNLLEAYLFNVLFVLF